MSLFSGYNASKRAELNKVFDIALQDTNGKQVYNSTSVHMGHLDPKRNLVVHKEVWDYVTAIDGYEVDLAEFGKINGHLAFLGKNGEDYKKESPYLLDPMANSATTSNQAAFWHMVIMNYERLLEAGLGIRTSAYAALFRSRWAFTGALAFLAKSSVDPSSEVTLIDKADKDYGVMLSKTDTFEIFESAKGDVSGLISVLEDATGGLAWVVKHAENLWAAVEHTFRVRSHHFKSTGEEATAYKKLYETFMNACYEGDFSVPEGFEWFHIAHTAIHPFKIEALPKATAHYLSHGLIADAASVRLSGAPVGNAVLTTTNAAMSTMASEVWYSAFKSIYKEELDELNSVTNQICDNKYAYHVAAGLYGMSKLEMVTMFTKSVTTGEARSRLSVLGAAAAGLIDALAEAKERIMDFEFALSNAKALRKASANNPLMNLKVRELIIKAVTEVADAADLTKAIEASLPGATALISASKAVAVSASPNTGP